MNMDPSTWDLGAIEEVWERRRARLDGLDARVDRRGMTRPQRNPEERAWLEERGDLPVTDEVATPLNEQGSTPRPRGL